MIRMVSLLDFVDQYTMSWRELDSVSEEQLSKLAAEMDADALTGESRSLINSLFDAGNTRHHLDMVRASGIFSLIALALFIGIDAYIIPDILWFSIAVKIGIITPLGLFCIVNADRRLAYIDILALSNYVIGELMVLAFMHYSVSPYAWVYVFGIALICINANLFQSVPSRTALLLTVFSITLTGVGLAISSLHDVPVGILVLSISACMCLFSLFGNYRIETGYRRQYMAALKEKLRANVLNDHNRQLSQDVALDGLTGIFNRRSLDQKLAEFVKDHGAQAQPLGILMIDVDHFKQLNDVHGHLAGDTCLRHVAALLYCGIRTPGDLVARFGGEEFVVLLPRANLAESLEMAESLRRAIEATKVDAEGVPDPIRLTVSIGCHAAVPASAEDAAHFVAKADSAVYAAKRKGRNRVCVAEDAKPGSLAS